MNPDTLQHTTINSLERRIAAERRVEQFTRNWQRLGWGGTVRATSRRKWRKRFFTKEYVYGLLAFGLVMAAGYGWMVGL